MFYYWSAGDFYMLLETEMQECISIFASLCLHKKSGSCILKGEIMTYNFHFKEYISVCFSSDVVILSLCQQADGAPCGNVMEFR